MNERCVTCGAQIKISKSLVDPHEGKTKFARNFFSYTRTYICARACPTNLALPMPLALNGPVVVVLCLVLSGCQTGRTCKKKTRERLPIDLIFVTSGTVVLNLFSVRGTLTTQT